MCPDGEVLVFRHLESAQTAMRTQKNRDELYARFVAALETEPYAPSTLALAQRMHETYPMPTSDKDLPLAPGEYERGVRIGQVLAKRHELGQLVLPDRLVISPTARTSSTAKAIVEGFPRLAAKLHEHPEMIAEDPNVVERLTGDSAEKYSDTKIFFGNHPEVYKERRDMGEDRAKLRFCYPGGESMLDVIERARAWESGRAPTEKIWMFTHMLFSIAFRLYQEGFDGGDTALQRYLYILRNESPPTGSLSTYIHSQETGRLVLHKLNEVLA